MTALPVQEPDVSREVAEGDQILAHDAERQRQFGQLLRHADGLPKAAQIFTARRPRPDMGQLGVFLRSARTVITDIRHVALCQPLLPPFVLECDDSAGLGTWEALHRHARILRHEAAVDSVATPAALVVQV